MKKYILMLLIMIAGITAPAAAAAATQNNIQIIIDGMPVPVESPPVIREGYTMVPFRAVAEYLGVSVDWDAGQRKVRAVKGSDVVELQIGNLTALYNGETKILPVTPLIINNRTMIPLRFFAEAFGCQVNWDGQRYLVSIISPPEKMTVLGYYALGDSKTSSWTDLFGRPFPEMDTGKTEIIGDVALGWYSVDTEGNLLTKSRTGWQRPEGWEMVLAAAEKHNLNTEMVVHITEKDGGITKFLANDEALDRFIHSVAAECVYYDGVNLDFEGLGLVNGQQDAAWERQAFNDFVSRLSVVLRSNGKGLTLSLHPLNSAYQGYDYSVLGKLADRIVIMAYDYGPKPEPDHSVIQAVEMALKEVPANKLLLGVSIPTETPETLIIRIGIAKKYDLQGIALWRLGLVSQPMWQQLRNGIAPR